MRVFKCPTCGHRLYFENSSCLACGSIVLYDPDQTTFALQGGDVFRCVNADQAECNWRAEPGAGFCRACALNQTIPDLSIAGNAGRWARAERAKKRAIYSLLQFGLPVAPKTAPGEETGIAFDLLAPTPGDGPGGEHILTGHDRGLITLNVAEADSVEREKMRIAMGERYRTLLGHFRHELGHYYWERLVRDDTGRLAAFREYFGDETVDYEQALQRHYAEGSRPDWQTWHITPYAASHPWEDWAETWAHYMHITDTLEMVTALEMPLGDLRTLDANSLEAGDTGGGNDGDRRSEPFGLTIDRWLVLSEAANSINRCMGLPDLYPFVISSAVAEKLEFVHRLLRNEQ